MWFLGEMVSKNINISLRLVGSPEKKRVDDGRPNDFSIVQHFNKCSLQASHSIFYHNTLHIFRPGAAKRSKAQFYRIAIYCAGSTVIRPFSPPGNRAPWLNVKWQQCKCYQNILLAKFDFTSKKNWKSML